MKHTSSFKVLTFCSALFLVMLAFTIDSSAQITKTLKFCDDNTMYEEFPNNSNGVGEHFFAGTTVPGNKRRGLIKFDALGEFIPQCATIQSVTLTLQPSKSRYIYIDHIVEILLLPHCNRIATEKRV